MTVLGGAAAAWPLGVRAQQPAMPVVGFMSARSANDSTRVVAAFRQGLPEMNYVEGRNVAIEYRWAEGQLDRLPSLARELVAHPVAVIAAVGASELAAKAATTTIPIIFGTGDDPVGKGVVTSLNRPEGNITGVTFLTSALGAKRLSLLRDLVPGVEVIALLTNPNTTAGRSQTRDVQDAASALGQRLVVLNADSDASLDGSFATLGRERVGALLVGGDPFFDIRRDRLIALIAQHRMPAIYQFREYALAGGLMSYGASITDMYRQVGLYVGRVLKGEKPGDLPVVGPTKFELVINLKTAKTLGLNLSDNFLTLANEVIE
jgi:putative ABC transport system substrate-binding protein